MYNTCYGTEARVAELSLHMYCNQSSLFQIYLGNALKQLITGYLHAPTFLSRKLLCIILISLQKHIKHPT